ncbi:MAG: Asp-tRNA(Asn)/Glu-tRNA(Gln) amidotransferase subunit GatB [Chloroflexota bacterium]|nr:Asp-tRNA(Asn)/Glu-tRNA(Gln) amidotransferase subunit GatB [Chloroflexota bacterium]
MEWEPVIGLEVHAQLLTKSKMFCTCPANYQESPPNSTVCPVCLAMPGVLPVINQQAVEFVIMTGIALNCSIAEFAQFDRKSYSYPDLMKGYQISQYENPISYNGWLTVERNGRQQKVGVTRAHLEEDVAKLQHSRDGASEGYALMDVNRAGVPLMEVVGEPDLRTADEAREYMTKLRSILRYIGVSTADMDQGSFRCDANVSVRPKGSLEYGTKVEVKNMNSFRSVHDSIEYELVRQVQLLEGGGHVEQETRGWDENRAVTVSQRSKEYANDYRYLPEPDLPPLLISREWVGEVQAKLPEMPGARFERFQSEYGLSEYDASLLMTAKSIADFFEDALKARNLDGDALSKRAKALANLVNSELTRLMNQSGVDITESKVMPSGLAELADLLDARMISSTQAKEVLEEMFNTGDEPTKLVETSGMFQLTDSGAVLPAVQEALTSNHQAVEDYLNGKETAVKFLVGQVMKISNGKADPALVNRLLEEQLLAKKR